MTLEKYVREDTSLKKHVLERNIARDAGVRKDVSLQKYKFDVSPEKQVWEGKNCLKEHAASKIRVLLEIPPNKKIKKLYKICLHKALLFKDIPSEVHDFQMTFIQKTKF